MVTIIGILLAVGVLVTLAIVGSRLEIKGQDKTEDKGDNETNPEA